ncbi:MAG: CRISPR-associated protein Csx11, partial [Bacteroidales bacterium]
MLHDIGKCYPDFVKTQSQEKVEGLPHHARGIDDFINSQLINFIKKVKVKFSDEERAIYDFIRYHHDANGNLLKYLEKCDRLDSADDKGIVRNKQSIENTIISSPFGFPKERIDLQFLQKKFECLQNNLIGLFQEYVSGMLDITCFRECLISYLKATFSHSLGESRIPANDITLWDHSYSTASLYKSVLCTLALGENPSMEKLQWRIFGFCWDGFSFINRGRKIEDIIQRNYIIEEIKNELKKRFEDEIPFGNAIYEDNNGIYFTFPALNGNESKELAKECARNGLEIIRSKSDNEIWPFFSLSKASRTLTMIAGELKFASEKRNIPKMTPTLFIDEIEKIEEIILDNPEIQIPKKGDDKEDICPICRLRTKPEKSERCNVCEERRKGRLESWFSNRENTIWIDEVADIDNRVALLTLSFNLEKWLDGTMIGTVYSQSFEDWQKSKKWEKIQNISIEANKDSVYQILDEILKLKDSDKNKAALLLNTFFEDISINSSNLVANLSNIEERIGNGNLTKENLATYLFTKNASPARLYRIWQ